MAKRIYHVGLGKDTIINEVLIKERYATLSKQERVVLDEEEIAQCKSRLARTKSGVFFGWAIAVSSLGAYMAHSNIASPVVQVGIVIALSSVAVLYFKDDLRKSISLKGILSPDGDARREELLKKGRWNWNSVERIDAVFLAGFFTKKRLLNICFIAKNMSVLKDKLEARRCRSSFSKGPTLAKPREPG